MLIGLPSIGIPAKNILNFKDLMEEHHSDLSMNKLLNYSSNKQTSNKRLVTKHKNHSLVESIHFGQV